MRSFRLPLLVAVAASLVLAGAGQASERRTTFERPTTLSPISPGTPYEDPQMAEGPDGTVTFVWSKTTFGDSAQPFSTATIQIRRTSPDGTHSPVTSIGAGQAAAYYVDPQVAVDASGSALVVWVDTRGAVHAVPVSVEGEVGDVQLIDPASAGEFAPQVVFDESGQAFASWTGSGGTVRVVALDAEGRPGQVHEIEGSGITRLVGGDMPRIIWEQNGHGVFSARLAGDGTPSDREVLVRGAPHTEFEPLEVDGDYLVVGQRTFAKVQIGQVLLARIDGTGPVRVLARSPLPYPNKPGSIFSGFGISSYKGRAVVSWRERSRNRQQNPSTIDAALVGDDGSVSEVHGLADARRVLMTGAAFGPNGDPVLSWVGKRGIGVARITRGGRARKVQRIAGSRSPRGERGLRMLRTQAGLRITWAGVRSDLDRRIFTSVDSLAKGAHR